MKGRKPRDFWITLPDNFYDSGSVSEDSDYNGSPQEGTKTYHVREVIDDLETIEWDKNESDRQKEKYQEILSMAINLVDALNKIKKEASRPDEEFVTMDYIYLTVKKALDAAKALGI